MSKKIIEEYKIKADNLSVTVEISGGEGLSKIYSIKIPEITKATLALLNEIKNQLIIDVKITTSEIIDPKVIDKLKKKFSVRASEILLKKLTKIKENTKNCLVNKLIRETLGLGDIEFLLNDTFIEEIVINSTKEPIRVYHKKYGWLETNITINGENQILNYANIIGRRVGRQITTLSPLLDAHLVTGDRANAVLYPISTKGHTITIRKFARDPWTVTDFIKNKTSNSSIMALIWLAFQYEMNVLVSGGTASGKTSMLNVCMPFIPPNHRIVSIEQTRELQLPEFLYWCPLTTRQPNPEGKGEINMLDLLVNSLRMRPDRIILGEVRRKQEAEVLFESMHTGHSVYATVHANTINETIQRLVSPPIEIAENLLAGVNLNVVMFRDRRKGIRRIFQLGEFLSTEEEGKVKVRSNILFRWKPTTDEVVKHAESLRFFEELNRHTGMTQSEISSDLKSKEKILNWLVKHNIRSIQNIGKIMRTYYLDPEVIVKAANKNINPETFLK